MMYLVHLRNDIRQIVRDPIMLLLLLVPLLLISIFKLLLVFLVPVIGTELNIDLSPYYAYVVSFVVLLSSGMTGIVTGFLMIDERDGNIAELMAVTPLGRFGYLVNRLLFSSLVSVIYSFSTIFVLNICQVTFSSALYLSVLMAVYSAIIGLILFSGADDKVKGLAFAKGLNILTFFAFTDLFQLPWLITLSWFFPPYWITAILKNPGSGLAYGSALLVHTAWLGFLMVRYWKRG
jgi:fluoroquinolone transport system permease protein